MNRAIDLDKLDKIFPQAYFDFADGCAEPGYDDKPVILADWNTVPNRVCDKLESHGYACEWSDEWVTCHNCYKAVRSIPNSYGWQGFYVIFDTCELICGECLEDYISEYLESIENDPKQALTSSLYDKFDPAECGYKLIESSFENGLHPHQTDDPKTILDGALKNNPQGKFIFAMTGQGQFDVSFALYERIKSE